MIVIGVTEIAEAKVVSIVSGALEHCAKILNFTDIPVAKVADSSIVGGVTSPSEHRGHIGDFTGFPVIEFTNAPRGGTEADF